MGQQNYFAATRVASLAEGSGTGRASLARQDSLASAYFERGLTAISDLRAGKVKSLGVAENHLLGNLLHRFETENEGYFRLTQQEHRATLDLTRWLSVGVIIGLSLLFGAIGQLLLIRNQRQGEARRRRDRKEHDAHREFTEVLQVTESEGDAYELIKRHVERTLPASHVTVMSRNNSRDRLELRTDVKPETELVERLLDAAPRSCLAIRLGREHIRTPDEEGLLTCSICECLGPTVCVPSLVGGEVIGSVLIERDEPLDDAERVRVVDTVRQASPALGNLRNLAVSESRALTDSLTGLPNARAVHDTLKRMVAQANRMGVPLSAIMVDLDHFKQINDTLGHEKGDDALAAAGDVLGSGARESDFVGRYGGDEFLVLLPNTDKEGALELAEKLRRCRVAHQRSRDGFDADDELRGCDLPGRRQGRGGFAEARRPSAVRRKGGRAQPGLRSRLERSRAGRGQRLRRGPQLETALQSRFQGG